MAEEFKVLDATIEFAIDTSRTTKDLSEFEKNLQKALTNMISSAKTTKDLEKAFYDITSSVKKTGTSINGFTVTLSDSVTEFTSFVKASNNAKKTITSLNEAFSTASELANMQYASDAVAAQIAETERLYKAEVNKIALMREEQKMLTESSVLQKQYRDALAQTVLENKALSDQSFQESWRMQQETEKELAGILKVDAARQASAQKKIDAANKASEAASRKMLEETQAELAAIAKKEAAQAEADRARAESIARSVASFNEVTAQYLNFDRSVLQTAKDMSLAFGIVQDGGSKLVALKTAMFGLNDATGLAGNAFKGLESVNESLNSVMGIFADKQTKLSNSLKRMSSNMSDSALAAEVLVNELKNVAKAETGTEKNQFNQLTTQIQNVTNEFQRLQRIIETGGKATPGEIARLKTEFQATATAIELNKTRVKDWGDDSKKIYTSMEGSIKSLYNGLNLIEQQNNRIVKEEQKVAQAAKEIGTTGEAAVKKSGISFEWFFNLFKSGKKDVEQFNVSLRNSSNQIKSTNQIAQGFGFTLSSLTGGLIGGGLVMAIPALFSMLQEKFTGAISAASDANEEMSKFAVVFDSNLDPAIGESDALVQQMIASFDDLAEKLGRSKYELRAMGAAFQDTFVPLGFAREEAAKLSLSLTGLTEDLSSFYNMTEKEVSDRISSFLVGNYENARAFGVIVNDAALDAELLKMGIEKGTEAVDQQVKSLVALKLLYAGTSDAQGDVVRTSDQFANMMRELQASAHDAAVELGDKLLPVINPLLALFLRLKTEIGPSISNMLNSMYNAILPLSDALVDVLTGASSFDSLQVIILNALNNIMDMMNSFIPVAGDWAWNWGVQIYNSLIYVANNLIAEAASYIGSVISSFLEPHSPPDKGPLSTIDKWGVGLMNVFSEGFQDSKVDLLSTILGPVADAMSGSGKTKEFQDIKNGFADIIEQATSTGTFDGSKVDALLSGVLPQDQIDETKKTLEEQAKLLKLQKDLETAKSSGDYTAVSSLKKQVEDQQAIVDEQQKRISAADKLQSLEDKVAEKQKANAASSAAALAKPMAAAKQSLDKYTKTAQETYDEEIANAQQIYDAKVLNSNSEEERLVALQELQFAKISAEKKLYKELDGEQKQQAANRIAEITKEAEVTKTKLAEIRKASTGGSGAGGKLTLADLGLNVEDFLPKKEDIQQAVYTFASTTANEMSAAITTKFTEVKDTFATNFVTWIQTGFAKVKEYVTTLTPEQILPFSLIIGGALLGLAAVLSPILSVIAGLIFSIASAFAGLILPIGLAIALGYTIYKVFVNWDEITKTVSGTIEYLTPKVDSLVESIKGFFSGLSGDGRSERVLETLKNIFNNILTIVITLAEKIGMLVAGGFLKLVDLFSSLSSSMRTSEEVGNRIGTIFEFILNVINNLIGSATQLVTGDSVFNPSGPLAAIIDIILSIKDTFVNSLTEIFKNSDVLNQTWTSLKQIFDAVLPVFTALGIVIAGVVVVALNILLSAIQSIAVILPYAIDSFGWFMTTIGGVAQTFSGLGDTLSGVLQFILGIFTGDFTRANELFQSSMDKFHTGITQVWTGLLGIVVNLGTGILAAVIQFVGSFIANIASFFGEGGLKFAEGVRAWTDAIIAGLNNTVNTVETTLGQLPLVVSTIAIEAYNEFVSGFSSFVTYVKTIPEKITTTFSQIGGIIVFWINDAGNKLKTIVREWLSPFYDFQDEVVGHSIIPDTVNEIVRWITEEMPTQITSWFTNGGLTGLLSHFITMGAQAISSFISSFTENLPSLSSLFSGWFGDSGSTGDTGGGIMSALSGLFGGGGDPGQENPSITTLDTIQTKLNELTTGMTAWVTNINMMWTTFTSNFYEYLNTSIINLYPVFTLFSTDFTLVITNFMMLVDTLVSSFSTLDSTSTTAANNAKTGFENNQSVLEDLIKVVDKVTKAYERMATAARDAAIAAGGALGNTGLTQPLDSYALGTDYVPQTGIYMLHKGEAVFTAEEADRWRTLLSNMDMRNVVSTKMNNAMSAVQSNVTNTKTASVQINANYQETKSPATIKDDVYTGLRLAGYGI